MQNRRKLLGFDPVTADATVSWEDFRAALERRDARKKALLINRL
jgi:hypothetical protein